MIDDACNKLITTVNHVSIDNMITMITKVTRIHQELPETILDNYQNYRTFGCVLGHFNPSITASNLQRVSFLNVVQHVLMYFDQ